MAQFATSYMPTVAAAVTRKVDSLTFPVNARPQALTMYVRFIELGTSQLVNARVAALDSVASNAPRLYFDVDASGRYAFVHQNKTTATAIIDAGNAPSMGDIVELIGHLNADGSTKIIQVLNSGAQVTKTDATTVTFATAWDGALIVFTAATGTPSPSHALLGGAVMRGVQTLATMRRVAGVS